MRSATALLLLCLAVQAPAQVTEEFESFLVPDFHIALLDVQVVDENAIANNQGPGLVLPGCSYSGLALQWTGKGMKGLQSRCIAAHNGPLTLSYNPPVNTLSFTLASYDTLSDLANITLFDPHGHVILYLNAISIPDSREIPFLFIESDIATVEIVGTSLTHTPFLDHHFYDPNPLTLEPIGTPGGQMDFVVNGFSPGGPVAYCFAAGTGSYSRLNPYSGLVITSGLSSAYFTVAHVGAVDGTGGHTFSTQVPAAAAGLIYVQAFDLVTDGTTRVVAL